MHDRIYVQQKQRKEIEKKTNILFSIYRENPVYVRRRKRAERTSCQNGTEQREKYIMSSAAIAAASAVVIIFTVRIDSTGSVVAACGMPVAHMRRRIVHSHYTLAETHSCKLSRQQPSTDIDYAKFVHDNLIQFRSITLLRKS